MTRTLRALPLLALPLLTAVGHAEEKVNLRFVVWDGDESMRALRQEVSNFEKAHPNIKVKFETVTKNYQEKLLAQVAANVAPDVAMMNPENFQRFARRDAIYELNQFFDDVPGFDIKKYYKNLVDAHSLNGKVYVLPRDIAPISVVYYNKRLLKEAGIPEPDGTWTWDWEVRPHLREKDFLWVIKTLSKEGTSMSERRWGYAPGWQALFTDMVYLQQGARLADDYADPTKLTYDDPRVVKAFEFSADLTLNKRWMPSGQEISNVLQTNARQMFTQQKVALFQSGIWEVPELRKELKPGTPGYFEWDIALAPVYAKGVRAYPTGGSGYCIMKSTKHPKEAWLLTQWMAGPPGQLAMARAGIAQPGIRELALQEPWIPGPNTPADQQVPKNRIITDQAADYVVFAPSSIHWAEVSGIAQQPHGIIYDGTSTAKVELPKGNRIAQERLNVLRREENLKNFDWRLGGFFGVAIFAALIGWIYAPERGKKRTLRERKENRTAYLFMLPWLLGVILFTAGPMILSFLMSFSDWDIVRPAKWRGVGNYVEAASFDPTFWTAIKVTFIYTIFAVPLGIFGSLCLAMLLNTKVKGMPLWRTCYYLPSIASAVAAALVWKKVFQPEGGLLNALIYGPDGKGDFLGLATLLQPFATTNGQVNWLGSEKTALVSLILMSAWGAGGGMIILLAGLQNVPQYLYEAATLDGAGPLRRFRNVTIPMISPTLFFTLITGFIGSFQVFTQAFIMTEGGPNNATMFYMLHLYRAAFMSLRMGYASALAWVLFFIILGFTVVQLRMSKWVHYEGARR